MAKFSIKKLAVAAISAAGLTALCFGAAGCLPKSVDLSEPDNVEISRTAPPDDGSLPTAHTCAENLAYIIYVFDNQPQYHSYSYGVTGASIATQTTRNFRDYKDGILLNTDLTYSSMVKGGTQTCSMYNDAGEYEVYFRTSAAPEADTLPAQALWSEEAPTYFNKKAYNYTYGLLPNELFNYIVNEQNIISSEQIKVNGDGTYTQNFNLDPVASTYYYQFGMKTRGGLSGYPDFESITFSVTFDKEWQILSARMHEVAKVNKGIVVTSVSDFETQYWYGNDHFDEEHYSYYEKYFKNYLDDSGKLEQGGPNDDKLTIDVTNVLSNGFSQIMNGGAQFEIALNLGANRYVGYAFVSLDLEDPLGTLAIKLGLGKSLKEQTLFIEYGKDGLAAYYGKDFALEANLAEVKAQIGELGEIIDKIKSAFTVPGQEASPEVQAEEGSDPITDLMNSMVLDAGEKQAVLTLDTDDLLGLGIGINARLVFGINNNKISFRSATVGDLALGGEKIDLRINLATTTAPEIEREPSQTGANLADYIADVHKLLGADLIKVAVTLDGDGEKVSIGALKGLTANVTAYADIDGVTVGAEADVSYTYKGHQISAKANVWYGYDPKDNNYGKAIVSLTEFNGSPVNLKIKCDIKEVAEAVSTLITFGGGDGGEATKGLAGIINGALSSDFSSLLTEMYADKAQIKVGVNVDALLNMLGLNTGIEFGSCTLKYARGEEDAVYGGGLSATLPALGLKLEISGEGGAVDQPDDTDCLDLVYLINDIKELATSELLKAHIALDGAELANSLNIQQLDGLTAEVDIYLNLESIAVAANLEVGYAYGEDRVCVNLSAWYDAGKVVLSLNAVNGAPLNAKVYCDITEIKDAVTALLQYADIKLTPFEKEESGESADIISAILGADFNSLLPVLETGDGTLKIAVNADEALALFGIDLKDVKIGNVTLAYDHGADSKLLATIPAFGLTADISGAAEGFAEMPAPESCLDLTKLVTTVQAVWEQVDLIIDNQSVAFEMAEGENFLSLDGIVVEIWGKGEVCWTAGSEYVALDLSMSITERATDVLTLKFIYDKNAVSEPLVKLALNNVGIEIYKDDIESVKNGFNDVYNKVTALLGKQAEETQPTEPDNAGVVGGNKFKVTDKLLGTLFGILADDVWVDVLNDFTLTTDGKSVALGYLSDNAFDVEIGADGGLSLYYDGAFGDRFTLSGGIDASAAVGDLREVIDAKLANCNVSSSRADGSARFIKLAYDYLFSAVSAIDVTNILGSDTYTVTFELNGENTNVNELKNVYVGAEIYFTGKNGTQPKLAEANLNIDAAGVVIKLNVITERRDNNTHFFINLSQVMDVKLPDLKFKATQQSLYETFDVLISTINNTNILDSVGKLIGSTDGEKTEGSGGEKTVITEEQSDKLADLIAKLLSFSFDEAVVATEVDGVTTATIDLDNIVRQLGFETGALGTVEAVINHNNHSMKTSGENDWISLASELAARRDYSKFDRGEYISIEFLPDLIGDLVKVATNDEGDLRTTYTLSGNIKANLVNIIDVNIDPCTVTVGIGENGLSASIVMHVNKAKVIGIGIPESTVGITYKNGLLTLAKGLNTSTPEYKVVTFDYFMDNMLSGDELLNWLLEISGWSLFKSYLPEIKSGLTTTQDVKLYEASAVKEEQEISMYSFVDALRVVIGGLPTAEFGDYGALESDLGVYDNYYGFALNAGAVTNGVLTKLNAAITRTEGGLDRVIAKGAIQSYVSFSANLQFKNNYKDEYQLGNTLQGEVTAPDLYEKAVAKAAEYGYVPDFDYFEKMPDKGYDRKFGCMSVTASGSGYSVSTQYSNVLYSHTLTIVKANGETEERLVRHGSTVYLYDNAYPVYTDESKTVRVLYSESGEVGAASLIMNGDVTVYEIRRAAVTVVVHNGSEEVIVNSFVDDKVPTSVAGLETITSPAYEDGTAVGDNDIIDGSSNTIHIYGTFVKTETVVNYVKYTFSAQTMSYTASGRAAGFNDYYSTKGNTLVLENEIGGYPVTAIAANAFANTEGKAIKSVVVPENIVTVGESAFADNVDMESAVFLAENVTFLGKDGNSKTMPFYGCSVSSNEEETALKVYYKNITASGGNWKHFRYVSKVFSFNFYIGDNGGAVYGKGSWQYVDYSVNVNTNGVSGGTLSEEAVKNILAPYFPYATAGSYAGSVNETNVNKAMENGIAGFTVVRGGITYACVYTAETSVDGGRTTVAFNVSYKATAEIYVQSSVAFGMYGKDIAADTLTLMTVPVEGDKPSLPTPASQLHVFERWDVEELNGRQCYKAVWRKKNTYTMTITLSKKLLDQNTLHAVDQNGNETTAKAARNKTATVTVQLLEGTVNVSLSGSVITVTDGVNTYSIYATEISGAGKETTNKRAISYENNSAVKDGTYQAANMSVNVKY